MEEKNKRILKNTVYLYIRMFVMMALSFVSTRIVLDKLGVDDYGIYDEEEECYVCDMNLDEDDMVRFLTGTFDNCPYYQLDNEYLIVRHQM